MDTHKINVKFFARDRAGVEQGEFVPVFHSWIQLQSVPEHALIDVADYAHVKDGPGILLVSHEANFYFDSFGGRFGFTYQRKQPAPGEFKDRLRQAIIAALESCVRLENDPCLNGRIQFQTNEVSIQLNDRLNAPNNDQTWKAVEPELRQVLAELYGANVTIARKPPGRDLFEATATSSQASAATELLSRLGVTASAW